MQTRREFFKLLGYTGTFALTVSPCNLLTAEASTPVVDAFEAPAYRWIEFRDELTGSSVHRIMTRWKGQEYGLEYRLSDAGLMNVYDPDGLVKHTKEIIHQAMNNTMKKVGAPMLTREVTAARFTTSSYIPLGPRRV
jgi:hypothetical protein